MCFEQTCIVYLIVRPSVWSSVRREDVSRDKKTYFGQTCVVYLIIWLSAVEGFRLEARRCILSNFVLFTEIIRPSVGQAFRRSH